MWKWSNGIIGTDLGHVLLRQRKEGDIESGRDYMDTARTKRKWRPFRSLHNFEGWDEHFAKTSTMAETLTSETGLDYGEKDAFQEWDPKLEDLYIDAYAEY